MDILNTAHISNMMKTIDLPDGGPTTEAIEIDFRGEAGNDCLIVHIFVDPVVMEGVWLAVADDDDEADQNFLSYRCVKLFPGVHGICVYKLESNLYLKSVAGAFVRSIGISYDVRNE